MRDAYPLTIALPEGKTAHLIPGKRPPAYTIDGVVSNIDVTIPPDLRGRWYWHGSSLTLDEATAFDTAAYPPPGAPYIPLIDCFAAARAYLGLPAPLVQLRLELT